MPKRPGSPLESQNTRKGPIFSSETNSFPGASVPVATEGQDSQPEKDSIDPPSKPSQTTDSSDNTKELSHLLSLEGLKSHEEIDAHFHIIAQELFSNYRIRIRRENSSTKGDSSSAAIDGTEQERSDVELEFMEMEFYLISPNVHEDPYCHGSLEQTQSGCWYFHRAPQYTASSTLVPSVGGGYRSGSRKGLDITLGSAVQPTAGLLDGEPSVPQSQKLRGGILLRSARAVSTGVIISGPSLLVDFILSACGVEDIKTLVSKKWEGDTSAFSSSTRKMAMPQLSVVRAPATRSEENPVTYYTTPRIGLDLSHATAKPIASNPRVMFVQRPYRFLVQPHLLKVNGRSQTFYGLLQYTMKKHGITSGPLALGVRDRLLKDIITIGGFTPTGARSYMQHYETGIKGGSKTLGSFCGAQGKGVCQSPEKLLRMFAALRTLSS